MRTPILLVLVPVLAGCLDERTLAVDVDEVSVPRGAGADLAVTSDGQPLARLDEISLQAEDPAVATVALTSDGTHVRITGRGEGETLIHLSYRDQAIAIPTRVSPPAIVLLSIEPSAVTAPIGAMVAIRATALDTTGTLRDVTDTASWDIADPRIARIDADGLHGMTAGHTTLHAVIEGRSMSVAVSVMPSL